MERRPNRRVVLGRVVGIFGIAGWIKVFSYTRPPEAILNYRPWQLEIAGVAREVQLVEGRLHGKSILARLAGYNDRDAAAGLVGAEIAAFTAQLPAAGEREYYWAELEGLRVVNLAGQELGHVSHLLETGANDVLVLRGERERLIPFGAGVIRQVNLDAGVIQVDWDADD